jgi:hypothetical protein
MPIFSRSSLAAFVIALPLASATTVPEHKSKPDLRCQITAWGGGSAAVANGGTAKGIVDPNGMRSLEYALTLKNDGGATGGPFAVRYDYVSRVGGRAITSSKPNITWAAMTAGQEIKGPKLKLSGSAPFPNVHEITVTLDTDKKIDESNEANNTCKFVVTVN